MRGTPSPAAVSPLWPHAEPSSFLSPFPHLLSTGGGGVGGSGEKTGPGCSGCLPIGPKGCMRVQEPCPHFQEPSGPALPEPGHPGQQPAKTSSNQTRSARAAMHRPLQTRPLPATWALVPSPNDGEGRPWAACLSPGPPALPALRGAAQVAVNPFSPGSGLLRPLSPNRTMCWEDLMDTEQ